MGTYEKEDIDYIEDEELLEVLNEQIKFLKKQALEEKRILEDIVKDTIRAVEKAKEVSARIEKKNNMLVFEATNKETEEIINAKRISQNRKHI